jgi:Leucine-rich repeat (LRR) protein
MKYLSTGVDPECDQPAGIFWGDDINEADLKKVTGLVIGKGTIGLSKIAGSKRIKYLASTEWSPETAKFVQTLPSLKHLHISRCRGAIIDAGKLQNLKVLSIFSCPGLESLKPFSDCIGLESLWISGCIRFKTLDGLSRYKKLGEFEIQGSMTKTGTLESIEPISGCGSLKYVVLATRIADESLSPIEKLKNLQHLWLQNRFKCVKYESILSACAKHKKIELHNGTFDRLNGFQEDED